jgi:Arm DNA-binding domain
VERIRPDLNKRLEIAEAILTGLYLVVQPSGKKSWAVRYRYGGQTRKLTLGGLSGGGPGGAARARAREALEAIAAGFDPAEEKRTAKVASEAPAAAAKPVDTFGRIARLFIAQYAELHTKTWPETARLLHKEVMPFWGERLFIDITRADVNELLRAILDRGAPPYTSNRTLAYLRKLWNWAVEEGYAESSPCTRVKKKAPEEKRDRALGDVEIRIC